MCTSDLQKVNRKEDLSDTSGPQMKILLYSIMKLTNDAYERKEGHIMYTVTGWMLNF